MANKKRLTIDDIAVAAGVSKTTISRYLNGRHDLVSEKTWARIQAVVEMTDYRPSDIASNLKKKTTNLIGVLISDISSPFSSALIIGITQYLNECGYSVLIANSEDSVKKEEENIRSLLSKGVCGLLVNTSSYDNPFLIHMDCESVPIVLMDRKVRNHEFSLVTSDHASGMQKLIQHLYEQGYTRPVLFTQDWSNNSTRITRRNSFIESVEKIYSYSPLDKEDIYLIDRRKGNSASAQLQKLLSTLSDDEVPIIIGSNSVTAACAANAILSQGLSMPKQIGLCGPEDWDWSTELNWPYLVHPTVTTLKVCSTEMGYQAASLLISKINNADAMPETRIVPCELIIRESTRLK